MARRPMVWDGWGPPEGGHGREVPAGLLALLGAEAGVPGDVVAPPVALGDVRVDPSRLPDGLRDRLARACGADGVLDDHAARVGHAAGRSYPDLLRLRGGDARPAPDAVVLPPDADAVAAVLAACAEASVAVVPFGGGTSVVGGVEPLAGSHAAVVALDLERLHGLLDLDDRSGLARFGAGTALPEADELLGRRGLQLGHLPQSYEHATVGGCIVTRSAGQASTGHGRMDDLVAGLALRAPAGTLELRPLPATAAGPDVRGLVVGSEGVLGVLTDAWVRVRPAAAARRYEGWAFASFAEGAAAFKAMEHAGVAPTVARLSDEEETRISLALAGGGAATRALGAYLRLRKVAGGCLAVVGWEGEAAPVAARHARATALLRRHGGVALGAAPGKAWLRGRFHGPYLRDGLTDHGAFVETLETATPWGNLERLHAAVGAALREALAGRGTPALVGCHVSHVYPDGASLYFTFIARAEAGEAAVEQWAAAKAAAGDAILAHGGTITHHHAVGRDHAPWLAEEIGDLGLAALRAAKAELDPAGIMNPGKLVEAGPGAPRR